jgi:hypothetical protein
MRWLAVSALPFMGMGVLLGCVGCTRMRAADRGAGPAQAVEEKPAATMATGAPSASAVAAATATAATDEADPRGGHADHAYAPRPSPAKAAAAGAPAKTLRGDPLAGAAAADPPAAPIAGFGVPAQFSGVKAGEWDDNANFRDFQKFLGQSRGLGFHGVDLRDRRFLVVRDARGQAMPHCRVVVSDAQQRSTSLLTTASGRAILFPHAEGLGEGKLAASADCGDGARTFATFGVGGNDAADALVDLRIPSERKPLGTRTVDLAFVLDTTGSMSEEIAAVKVTIQKVAQSLSDDQTQVRVGMVEYKDRGDAFVTRAYPFSTDLRAFAQRVSQISAGGGGDTPEDMNAGLHAALGELAWSDQSVARLAFVIADAPPHLEYQGPDYAADMRRAAHRGIQLFTVAASGMDDLGQVVFRQMAQYTGATNMFVLRGGAGPQSTGGGDAKSSCGGTHANYASGKLDELIVHKVRRELRALDADPMRIAGLGRDENAKPCEERIVFAD